MTTSLMHQETLGISTQAGVAVSSELPLLPVRPERIYTMGRGSSDHASMVMHYLLGSAGIPACCLPMSLVSDVVDSDSSLYLAISQSGASPDICDAAARIRQAGCDVLSLVNHENSPLADVATCSVSQHAGSELAVAATKSVICSILMGARLAEHWATSSLNLNLDSFPDQVTSVQRLAVQPLKDIFIGTGPIVVIGRGSGYGIACEIALKLQELLGRAAMAYSSSEFMHGPAGMITPDYPILALAVGPERNDVLGCVEKLKTMDAACHVLDDVPRTDKLSATLLLCHVYLALEAACVEMGHSPDNPRNLKKVTFT